MIIWLASYPRSGNTYLRVILNSIFGLKTYSLYNDQGDIGASERTADIVGHRELEDDFDIESANASDTLYLIKTHDAPRNDKDKAIYLIRDGRQCSLSYSRYKLRYSASPSSLDDIIYGNDEFGGWSRHVESWNPQKRANTLLLKFEELVDRPEDFIKPIAQFIGVEPSGENIPTFEQLHSINPNFFRQGRKDSWKEEFTIREHRAFWARSFRQMTNYGYVNNIPGLFANSELTDLVDIVSHEMSYWAGHIIKSTKSSSAESREMLASIAHSINKFGNHPAPVALVRLDERLAAIESAITKLQAANTSVVQENSRLMLQVDALKSEMQALAARNERLTKSMRWRLGSFILWPLRVLGRGKNGQKDG